MIRIMLTIGIFLIIISILSIIKNRYNFIIVLLSFELLLISFSLFLIQASSNLDDFSGIINAILLLIMGAIETSIGLSILIIYKNSYHN